MQDAVLVAARMKMIRRRMIESADAGREEDVNSRHEQTDPQPTGILTSYARWIIKAGRSGARPGAMGFASRVL